MIDLVTNVLVRYLANGCDYTVTFDKKASAGTGYRILG